MARPKGSKNKLGTKVKKVIETTGLNKIVGDCKACQKREQMLNNFEDKIKSFFKRNPYNKMTEEQKQLWSKFLDEVHYEREAFTISKENRNVLLTLLKDVCNMSVSDCPNCSISIWRKYINMVNTVYLDE